MKFWKIETRIDGVRSVKRLQSLREYFDVYNIDYSKEEVEVEHKPNPVVNYSRIEKEGIGLDSQVIQTEKGTSYESIAGMILRDKNYIIEYDTWTVQEVVERIYEEFEIRNWEGKVLQFSEDLYTQNNLLPKDKIRDIILKSMKMLVSKAINSLRKT
ncbi:MAG: hypothetical protein R3B71_04070 [Candidatus Gracilibacteria bacterium]